MLEAMDQYWGNPSSGHTLGSAAKKKVEQARAEVASLIGADSDEVLFTSGSTLAINIAIRGLLDTFSGCPVNMITSAIEHKAVIQIAEYLHAESGLDITALVPDRQARIDSENVRGNLSDNTVLVALAHGNNEVGTLNPIGEIGRVLESHSAEMFVDASQTGGYFPPEVQRDRVGLMVLSGHKMYGPKGIAALYVRRGLKLKPMFHGGGQEKGLVSGTLNVPAIVGLGQAAKIARQTKTERVRKVSGLRERFLKELRSRIPDLAVNGHPSERLPGNLSVIIPYVPADSLQARLPHLAFSRSSACSADGGEPSHVLMALGLSARQQHWTVRFGLSEQNDWPELQAAATDIANAVSALRDRH